MIVYFKLVLRRKIAMKAKLIAVLCFAFVSVVQAQTQQNPIPASGLNAWCFAHPGETVIVSGVSGVYDVKCKTNPPPPAPAYVSPPQVEPVVSNIKNISFIRLWQGHVYAVNLGDEKDWIAKWVRKNVKKYPNVHFSDTSEAGAQNYVVVLTASEGALYGFQPTLRTDSSTSYVSGSGSVTGSRGGTWFYTYNGTVNTTTTYKVDAPYAINETGLYATAYEAHGLVVAKAEHIYSTQSGRDGSTALGYNAFNAFDSINARGRLLKSVVSRVAAQR
jgi:hypothetical protein